MSLGIPDPDDYKSKKINPVDPRILDALNTLRILPDEEIVFLYTNQKEYEWCMAAIKYVKSIYPKANVTADEWKAHNV